MARDLFEIARCRGGVIDVGAAWSIDYILSTYLRESSFPRSTAQCRVHARRRARALSTGQTCVVCVCGRARALASWSAASERAPTSTARVREAIARAKHGSCTHRWRARALGDRCLLRAAGKSGREGVGAAARRRQGRVAARLCGRGRAVGRERG